jgi:hypothetical protein
MASHQFWINLQLLIETEDRLTNTISEDQKRDEYLKVRSMVNLESVTLIALTSVRLEQTVKALEYSCKGINFAKVKLISDVKPDNLPDYITHEFTNKNV